MLRAMIGCPKLPLARLPLIGLLATALGMIAVTATPAHAQLGGDGYYRSGAYYDDGIYDDDWYYDYYDQNDSGYGYGYGDGYYEDGDAFEGTYFDDEYSDYEYEPGEGVHEEEWYDPSDWFDNDPGIDVEND